MKEPLRKQMEYYKKRIRRNLTNFIKWIALGVLVGLAVGAVSSLFAEVITGVTAIRTQRPYLFYLLPFAGLLIVFFYQKVGKEDGGTTQVLSTIRSRDDVPLRSAPLIFIATALTHLTGGSAGREGAAIQLGGSLGNQFGRWFCLDEEDRHVMVMCGMSAAFSAVFGTPMAAAVFSMEVVSVGVMYYAALLPCVTASLVASQFAVNLGVNPETFHVTSIPALGVETALKMVAVVFLCAIVSILFCMTLRAAGDLYGKFLKNPYLRVFAAGVLIIALTALLGTTDYMGAGNGLIERAIEQGEAEPLSFFWKMVLTALTMRAGFRGGEIVPSFCIGATLGCVLGRLFQMPSAICAAAGMTALFCGVTNCPITSILIAFELFGFQGVSYYLIAVAVSYAVSGYYGLYRDQTIVYSKYKAKYVNHHTRV